MSPKPPTFEEHYQELLKTQEISRREAHIQWARLNTNAMRLARNAFFEDLGKIRRARAKKKKVSRPPFVRPKYEEYINSEAWLLKRKSALEHHGALCHECGKKEHLQVHHLTYKRLGREKMKDLQILCYDCHMKVHEEQRK